MPGARTALAFVAWRVGILVGALVPAFGAAYLGLAREAARQPYFADAPTPLPAERAARLLLAHVPPAFLALAVAAVLVYVWLDQSLTAAALAHAPGDPPPRRWPAIRMAASPHVGAMLRVVLAVLGAWAAGAFLVAKASGWIAIRGERAGWTGLSLHAVLPSLQVLATAAWMALAAAWGHAARALVVADGRRFTRRALWLAARLIVARPIGFALLFVALTLVVQLASGVAMIGWGPAETPGAVALRSLAWIAAVLAQASAWYVLVRRTRAVVDDDRAAPLRRTPDAPYVWWGALRARIARRLASWA